MVIVEDWVTVASEALRTGESRVIFLEAGPINFGGDAGGLSLSAIIFLLLSGLYSQIFSCASAWSKSSNFLSGNTSLQKSHCVRVGKMRCVSIVNITM